MKFEVVSTREFSEEDLQYAVERALKYLDEGYRLITACEKAYEDMIEKNEDYDLVADWVWCIFEGVVIEEIKQRLEAVEKTKRKIKLLRKK